MKPKRDLDFARVFGQRHHRFERGDALAQMLRGVIAALWLGVTGE